jgi:prefoldin subunit 5
MSYKSPILASDGDAVERLQAELQKLETLQARMKEANKAIRTNAKLGPEAQIEALVALGLTQDQARGLVLKPDWMGRIGFPDYAITNNGANIRRIQKRIESVRTVQSEPDSEFEGENARFEDAPGDNRVRLYFSGKPNEDIRTRMKASGWRWTPTVGCWQAYRNWSSLELAKELAGPIAARSVEAEA